VPQRLVLLAAGALFLFFAFRSWRDAEEAEEADAQDKAFGRGALLTSFLMILLAEFGDKTQLAMVGLAAGTGAPGSVLVGGTLALWAVSLVGILVGGSLLRRISPVWMHRTAALLFLTFGLFALWNAVLAPESGLAALLPSSA
jgi:Ca2+/H+ antiporter, TMEM165/GDT1 family